MLANDLINFWEQTILKWPFSGHFEFEKFCDIYVTQKQSKKAEPCICKPNVNLMFAGYDSPG